MIIKHVVCVPVSQCYYDNTDYSTEYMPLFLSIVTVIFEIKKHWR